MTNKQQIVSATIKSVAQENKALYPRDWKKRGFAEQFAETLFMLRTEDEIARDHEANVSLNFYKDACVSTL